MSRTPNLNSCPVFVLSSVRQSGLSIGVCFSQNIICRQPYVQYKENNGRKRSLTAFL